MEAPDRGLVSSYHRGDGAFLRHSGTGERVGIDPALWGASMEIDGDGFCKLVQGETEVWASDIFRCRLVVDEDVGPVILDGEDATHLQERWQAHRKIMVPLLSGSGSFGLAAYLFTWSQGVESKIWWGLASTFEAAGMCNESPGKWVSNWYRWWDKRCRLLDLPPPHLRPSVRATKDESAVFSAGDIEVDFRCLPEASMSSAAFVALLFRMAKACNKKKVEETRMRWAAVAAAMVQHCLPESFELVICMSRLWDTLLGLRAKNAWARILVRAGVAHLASATGGMGQTSLLIALAGNRGTLPIMELAWAFDAKKSHWLLTQLALEIGRNVDEFIHSCVTPAGILELHKPAEMTKSSRKRLTKLACKWVQRSQKDLKGLLCKYYFSGRRYFAPLSSLSFAVDATRIGRKQCLMGCVASPGNVLMWSPPQVPRLPSKPSRLSPSAMGTQCRSPSCPDSEGAFRGAEMWQNSPDCRSRFGLIWFGRDRGRRPPTCVVPGFFAGA